MTTPAVQVDAPLVREARALAGKSFTGELVAENNGQSVSIFFDKGQVRAITSPQCPLPVRSLGLRLVNMSFDGPNETSFKQLAEHPSVNIDDITSAAQDWAYGLLASALTWRNPSIKRKRKSAPKAEVILPTDWDVVYSDVFARVQRLQSAWYSINYGLIQEPDSFLDASAGGSELSPVYDGPAIFGASGAYTIDQLGSVTARTRAFIIGQLARIHEQDPQGLRFAEPQAQDVPQYPVPESLEDPVSQWADAASMRIAHRLREHSDVDVQVAGSVDIQAPVVSFDEPAPVVYEAPQYEVPVPDFGGVAGFEEPQAYQEPNYDLAGFSEPQEPDYDITGFDSFDAPQEPTQQTYDVFASGPAEVAGFEEPQTYQEPAYDLGGFDVAEHQPQAPQAPQIVVNVHVDTPVAPVFEEPLEEDLGYDIMASADTAFDEQDTVAPEDFDITYDAPVASANDAFDVSPSAERIDSVYEAIDTGVPHVNNHVFEQWVAGSNDDGERDIRSSVHRAAALSVMSETNLALDELEAELDKLSQANKALDVVREKEREAVEGLSLASYALAQASEDFARVESQNSRLVAEHETALEQVASKESEVENLRAALEAAQELLDSAQAEHVELVAHSLELERTVEETFGDSLRSANEAVNEAQSAHHDSEQALGKVRQEESNANGVVQECIKRTDSIVAPAVHYMNMLREISQGVPGIDYSPVEERMIQAHERAVSLYRIEEDEGSDQTEQVHSDSPYFEEIDEELDEGAIVPQPISAYAAVEQSPAQRAVYEEAAAPEPWGAPVEQHLGDDVQYDPLDAIAPTPGYVGSHSAASPVESYDLPEVDQYELPQAPVAVGYELPDELSVPASPVESYDLPEVDQYELPQAPVAPGYDHPIESDTATQITGQQAGSEPVEGVYRAYGADQSSFIAPQVPSFDDIVAGDAAPAPITDADGGNGFTGFEGFSRN